MKRIIFIFLATVMSTTICSAAMSNGKVRKETLFLSDKMAYELDLSVEQYNDIYEINYDFISGIRYLMDDVLRGEEWALNRYYDYLDMRNDDLRWVLSNRQYSRFMQASYFYRPIYVNGGHWRFRVYINYSNHNHYYRPHPRHYKSYNGGHYRKHYHNKSYYKGRYNHPVHHGVDRIRNDRSYQTTRRSDFGTITMKPNSSKRPEGYKTSTRRTSNSNTKRENVNSSSRVDNKSNSSTRRSVSTDNSSRRPKSESTHTKVENTRTKNNNTSSTRRTKVETDSRSKSPSSNVRSSENSSRKSNSSSSRSSNNSSSRKAEKTKR